MKATARNNNPKWMGKLHKYADGGSVSPPSTPDGRDAFQGQLRSLEDRHILDASAPIGNNADVFGRASFNDMPLTPKTIKYSEPEAKVGVRFKFKRGGKVK